MVYFVSGKLQACPNYALHLHPLDCRVVATQWNGDDMSKSWIELSNDATSPEYWILTPTNAPCPSKMLTAEAGTLRGTDFFRSPLTQWKIPGRDASPWPHRSSFLLLPEGSGRSGCATSNASAAIEKEGLSNPAQCCGRGGQELQLSVSFGSFGTGSGRYDVCWGRTFGDGLNGGADSPLPASDFPIFVGVLSLLAPESLGIVECTLHLPCSVTVSGLGLSSLDSLVVHSGSTCDWPELPPFDMEGAPDCSPMGSDSYLKAELVGNQRLIVATTCPRGGYEDFGVARPKAMRRTYPFPSVAQIFEKSSEKNSLPLPDGVTGVALDGLAISGTAAPRSLWEQSQCGLVIEHAMAVYALTPGGQWGCDVVKAWALDSAAFNASHEHMLGFMMDGVPLFAPLSNLSNFTLDECGGHNDDLPFYHYHAADSFDTYSGKLLGCLQAMAFGGKGFAVPAARISWPSVRPQHFVELDALMASFSHGQEEVLLTNARAAARFLPQSVDNSSQAVYSIQRPGEMLNYSICWGRGLALDEHQVYLGTLILIGPFKKDYLCTLAQTCAVTIEGAGLSLDNLLFVGNDTCDFPFSDADEILDGLGHMPTRPVSGFDNSSSYNLGVLRRAVVGPTLIKLCWSDSLGNVVEVGALEFLGPARFDQQFTCSLGRSCNLRVDEYGLGTSLPFLRVGASCEEAFVQGDRVPPETLPVASWKWEYSFSFLGKLDSMDPGYHALCWHPEGSPEGSHGSIQIGTLKVRGPIDLQLYPPIPLAGMSFQLQLRGVNLLDTDDVRILENSSHCGSDAASQYVSLGARPGLILSDDDLPFDDALFNSSTSDTSSDTSDSLSPEDSDGKVSPGVTVWENVTIQLGGFFKVCWCAGDWQGACREDTDFAVNAGSITVRGPMPLASTEIQVSGAPFLLQISGVMLSESDRIHIVPAGRQCFKAENHEGIQLDQPNISQDGTEAEWDTTIWTPGLFEACYALCQSDEPCVDNFIYIGDINVKSAT
eukprot:Skav214390  [mRNA]  locus=scaffold333:126367:129357:- [translate_table: standard]